MWWIRVGGYPATEIAPHDAPTIESWADGGCGSASWSFAISVRAQHQAIRLNAPVEVLCGPLPVFAGQMTEPDRTTGECVAHGMASFAKNYLALDGTGANTRDLGTAITQAISRGWNVSNPLLVSGTAAGDASGNPVSVGQLLDDYAAQTGQRWGVDAKRRLYVRPDPVSPMWLASPGAAAFGNTTEGRAGKLFGRYLDSATGLYETAWAGEGEEAATDELVERGEMSRAAAEAILAGILLRDRAGPAWTNGATLSRDQIQTAGGTRAALGQVQAQQMVRAQGLRSALKSFGVDAVIGKVAYVAGSSSIYVEPVNTAPRTFADIIAAA